MIYIIKTMQGKHDSVTELNIAIKFYFLGSAIIALRYVLAKGFCWLVSHIVLYNDKNLSI